MIMCFGMDSSGVQWLRAGTCWQDVVVFLVSSSTGLAGLLCFSGACKLPFGIFWYLPRYQKRQCIDI